MRLGTTLRVLFAFFILVATPVAAQETSNNLEIVTVDATPAYNTLWGISLATARTQEQLLSANPAFLAEWRIRPNGAFVLRIGETLTIPPEDAIATPEVIEFLAKIGVAWQAATVSRSPIDSSPPMIGLWKKTQELLFVADDRLRLMENFVVPQPTTIWWVTPFYFVLWLAGFVVVVATALTIRRFWRLAWDGVRGLFLHPASQPVEPVSTTITESTLLANLEEFFAVMYLFAVWFVLCAMKMFSGLFSPSAKQPEEISSTPTSLTPKNITLREKISRFIALVLSPVEDVPLFSWVVEYLWQTARLKSREAQVCREAREALRSMRLRAVFVLAAVVFVVFFGYLTLGSNPNISPEARAWQLEQLQSVGTIFGLIAAAFLLFFVVKKARS